MMRTTPRLGGTLVPSVVLTSIPRIRMPGVWPASHQNPIR